MNGKYNFSNNLSSNSWLSTPFFDLPSDIFIEEKFLGSLMRNLSSFAWVEDIIDVNVFSFEIHRRVFKILKDLYMQNVTSLDVIKSKLGEGVLSSVEIDRYLMNGTENREDLVSMAVYLRDLARRREVTLFLIRSLTELQRKDLNVKEFLGKIFTELTRFYEGLLESRQWWLLKDCLQEYYQKYLAPDRTEEEQGITTSIKSLDSIIKGFTPGYFVIIAGRPSVGKTAFALSLAKRLALRSIKVGFISGEMTKDEISERFWAMLSRVPMGAIRGRRIHNVEFDTVYSAQVYSVYEIVSKDESEDALNLSKIINNIGIVSFDSKDTLWDIKNIVRILVREFGARVVFIDYLQLIQNPYKDTRWEQVGEVSRTLKTLAKELGIVIIAISQLNREIEKRKDKKPTLADLRESGQIEQDADVVMFLYKKEREKKKGVDIGNVEWEPVYLYVGKNRQGATGELELKFLFHVQDFLDEEEALEEGGDLLW